jgi:hypothetical protein
MHPNDSYNQLPGAKKKRDSQTMYAHVNKWIKKILKKEERLLI